MTSSMSGRVAVVTGGSRGIGRAITEALLAEDCQVVISGRSAEKGQLAVAEMAAGEKLVFVAGDARAQSDVEGLIDTALAEFGRVDILVNNAGGSSGFAEVADLSDEAWREAQDWVLTSAFWATRRALPSMVEHGWGRIVNISSVEGKMVKKPMASHYATFKAALIGFTRAVAAEYSPRGITVNAVCPGAVETDLMNIAGRQAAASAGVTYEEFLDGYASESLTKKINTVEEIAATTMLLVSDAGSGITGTAINVDGGTSPY
jgi:NAD(P)-dependent dehydrogenase (short-subunit alcohol dehydrogenase family)